MGRTLTQIYNIDPRLLRDLSKSAKDDHRSLSKQMQVLLREALNARNNKPAE